MTFEEWRNAKRYCDSFMYDAEMASVFCSDEDAKGWIYSAGWVEDRRADPIQGDTEYFAYYVPLPNQDAGFHTLAEAEAFLWAEWCDGEING